jgi:hypothetical protein
MLSLKKKPIIRYEKMSGMARKLGVELQVRFLYHAAKCRIQAVLEPYPSRVPALRLPINPSSSAPPHPRQAKRPGDADALAVDVSSNGPRTIGDSERTCGYESSSRYSSRAFRTLLHDLACRMSGLTRNHTGNHIDHVNRSVLPGAPPGNLW